MKLITAHKILITSSVVFFIFFGIWELRNYAAGNGWAGFRGGLYFLVALGFAAYLSNLRRWYK